MLNINKKAFTLVELIVVITILAILGTIGFISLQGYSSEARDSKRVTDLGQIRTGIQVYQAKEGVVPESNDAITVGSGSTIYTIQGYAGTGVLNNIRVNDDAKDPLEDNYYTYSTNGAKTKFQLLALLENNNTAYNIVSTTYANYETRDLYSVGDKLGILLDSTTNIPIQELGETEVDLSTNSTEYKAVFSKSDIQTLSGTSLHQEIVTKSNNYGVEENIVYSSCKEILDNGASTGDGTYTIDPENNGVGFDVYCDMTTDGGGWTYLVGHNLYNDGDFPYNPTLTGNSKSFIGGKYKAYQGDSYDGNCSNPRPSFEIDIFMEITEIDYDFTCDWYNSRPIYGYDLGLNGIDWEKNLYYTYGASNSVNIIENKNFIKSNLTRFYMKCHSCQNYQKPNYLEINYLKVR